MKAEPESGSFDRFKDQMRKLFSVSKADLDAALRKEQAIARKRGTVAKRSVRSS